MKLRIVGRALTAAIGMLLPLGMFAGAFTGAAAPLASAASAIITREQFIVDLARQLQVAPRSSAAQVFSDVPSSDPDFGYVMAAYEKGWISGFPGGVFRPRDTLTREQIAKVLVVALGLKATAQSLGSRTPNYKDAGSIGRWAFGYVDEATALGVLQGFAGGTFGPGGVFTQGEESRALAQLQAYVAAHPSTPATPPPPLTPPTPPTPPAPPRYTPVYAPGFAVAPAVAASANAGGCTTITARPVDGDTLTVAVSSSGLSTPLLGSAAPTAGPGVTTGYASGADLPASAGDFVGVYDVTSSRDVVAFNLVGPLRSADIAALPASLTVAAAASRDVAGDTTISATVPSGDTLTLVVASPHRVATPAAKVRDAPAAGGAGMTLVSSAYTSGADFSAVPGDFVAVYEVDGRGDVVGFGQIQLASSEIAAPAPPIATISAAAGSVAGDTAITVTPNRTGDAFTAQDVGQSPAPTPTAGAVPPSGATAYTSGSNLTAAPGDRVAVYELDQSGHVVAFQELSITDAQIAAAASGIVSAHALAGSVSGTTAITLTPSAIGDTFRANDVGGAVTAIPLLGATPPIGATTYTSGDDLAAAPGDHLDLYELDGSDHIVAFTELAITSAQIAVPAISVVSVVAGSVYGTTAVTLTPSAAGDSFKALDVGGAVTAIPIVGATPPSGAAVYTSGSSLAAAPGDHLDLYELDGSGHVVAFTEIAITGSQILGPAPLISNITAAPGDFTGATALTLTPDTSGDTFRAKDVGSTATAIPLVGDTPPVGATTYTSGSSFIVTTAGDHVDVYELNASGHVVAFTELTITSAQIHP